MLQLLDGVVRSIREVRPVFPEMSDQEFATWYEKKFMVTEKRVLTILDYLNQYK